MGHGRETKRDTGRADLLWELARGNEGMFEKEKFVKEDLVGELEREIEKGIDKDPGRDI